MKKIAVVPFDDSFKSNSIFEFQKSYRINYPFYILGLILREKYIVNTIDLYDIRLKDVDLVLFLGIEYFDLSRSILLKIPSIYIAIESPIVQTLHSNTALRKFEHVFDRVLTWNDKVVDNKVFYKMNLPMRSDKPLNYDYDLFNKKEFLVTQFSNNYRSSKKEELYSLRKIVNEEFKLLIGDAYHYYGAGWNKKDASYKGLVEDKISTLNNYKFVFCIENALNDYGYISEKLYDAFLGRSVPIYYGATNISNMVPVGSYIDFSSFENMKELYDYISSIEKREYMAFINAANTFLNSKNVNSPQSFSRLVRDNIDDFFLDSGPIIKKRIPLELLLYINVKAFILFLKRVYKFFFKNLG